MSVTKVETKAEFDAIIKGNDKVVVDFFAEWCGPCRMIAPKIEQLAKENTDIKFIKIDVDQNSETSEEEGISAMPTFRFYKGGVRVGEVVGASEEKIKTEIAKLK